MVHSAKIVIFCVTMHIFTKAQVCFEWTDAKYEENAKIAQCNAMWLQKIILLSQKLLVAMAIHYIDFNFPKQHVLEWLISRATASLLPIIISILL